MVNPLSFYPSRVYTGCIPQPETATMYIGLRNALADVAREHQRHAAIHAARAVAFRTTLGVNDHDAESVEYNATLAAQHARTARDAFQIIGDGCTETELRAREYDDGR